jgi:hypothetical protein
MLFIERAGSGVVRENHFMKRRSNEKTRNSIQERHERIIRLHKKREKAKNIPIFISFVRCSDSFL